MRSLKLVYTFNRMVRQMRILTEFGNLHISLKSEEYFAKKDYPVAFCRALAYLP